MRVLHVIKGLGPGGAERLLVSMAVARSSDLDFHVAYVLAEKGHLVPELEAAGATVHLLGEGGGLADLRWVVRLVSLARSLRPDVVHLHSPAVAALARPALRSMRARRVIFSTEHNEWPSFRAPTRAANALTLPLSDVHLAVSDEVRSSMSGRHRDRTEVLVHGIPVDLVMAGVGDRRSVRRDLGLADDDVVVTIVANFREKKDYPTLLRAAALACGREPTLRFLSIGQGPLEPDLRRMGEDLDLGDRFRFLGYQPDPVKILGASDIFTLTSRHEGLSIALLEALAVGLPCVVSAVGGIRSVVSGLAGARSVVAGDVEGFAAAYIELARDAELRTTMSRCAVEHAKQFDIAKAQHWLEDRYRDAL